MTTQALISYILTHIRDAHYVKGPIYLDGIVYSSGGPSREQMRKQLEALDAHDAALANLRSAQIDETLLKSATLVYAYHHLDHPEAAVWGKSTDAYSRPTREQILSETTKRVAAIDQWNEVMEEIMKRVMNPYNIPIPAKEWECCKMYPQQMSEKTVYETGGNYSNSHGMCLTTSGWMSGLQLATNPFVKPAHTLTNS